MKKKNCLIIFLVFLIGIVIGNLLNLKNSAKASDSDVIQVEKTFGVEYLINSGEAKALRYQSYNIASKRLEELKKEHENEENLAVILDIDETILKNYYYLAQQFLGKEEYKNMSFSSWVQEEKGTIIEGAEEFLNKAKELNIEMFYITNRALKTKEATINNLNSLNLPYADENHILLKESSSSKESRVKKVQENHNVLMYLGDNLGDFPEGFYKKSNKERCKIVEENKEKFGVEYIIIPNTIYGTWDDKTFNEMIEEIEGYESESK